MRPIERRLHFPAGLNEALTAYANALMRGDADAGLALVAAEARADHGAICARAERMRAFDGFAVIARARLGFQYIAKIRFHNPEYSLTLQCRWRDESQGGWRIVEIADIGLRSPWLKPESEACAVGKANG